MDNSGYSVKWTVRENEGSEAITIILANVSGAQTKELVT